MNDARSPRSVPRALDENALFEALCKVDAAGSPARPAAAVRAVLRELAQADAHDAEDDLPDFSKEPLEPPPAARASAPDPSPAASPRGGGHDDVVEALVTTLAEYQGLLKHYNRAFDEAAARGARGEIEDDDEVIARLREAQALLVKYPLAGQAAFAALVREGRRFARTREGQRWQRRLAPSPLLAHARTLFEGVARGLATEGSSGLPSTYVDALLRALDRDLEEVLADVEGAGGAR